MPETVLIVYDEPAQLRIIEHVVSRKLRYQTVTASGGKGAIEWIVSGRQPSPDLVLLNLSVPGTDELLVIRTLRACRPHLPIIVLCQFGEDGRVVFQAIQAGADDFLTEPAPLARLRVSIANALKLRRMAARVDQLESGTSARGQLTRTTSNQDGGGAETLAMIDMRGRAKTLRTIEEEAIRFVLHRTGGSVTRTARSLGIGRSTLYRRLVEFNNDGQTSRERPQANQESLSLPELVE
jgi:DNA-binding NtrC family response regulator